MNEASGVLLQLAVALVRDVLVHKIFQAIRCARAVESLDFIAAGLDQENSGVGGPLDVVQRGLVAVTVEGCDDHASVGFHGLTEGFKDGQELLAVLAERGLDHEQDGAGGIFHKVGQRLADEDHNGAIVGSGLLLTLDAAGDIAGVDVGVEAQHSFRVVKGVSLRDQNVTAGVGLVSNGGEGLNGERLLGGGELLHVEPGEQHA
ncbi:Acyl- thioester hydrolase, putative [Babesia ovata]|uniref:Acyl-thioester hydrolase, putative n=1 Tax=Babesia ovata TaxID=189622 RepID=A0A2H6KHS9_9APIC|nr:Acyl- thioester hydrolase, putative [Babesia ovata]GBE62548.1 Acyl- thioester hydrolase, putative [Babesia ovata]